MRRAQTILVNHNTGATGADWVAGFQFSFDQLLGYTEFTPLFQEYRINCIVLTMLPCWDSCDIGDLTVAATNLKLPSIGWVIDYNDANTPSGAAALQQYSNYREKLFKGPIKIKVWPCLALASYVSGVTTGYTVKRKQWVHIADTGVKHYGIKMCIFNFPTNTEFRFTYFLKFYVSLRNMY